MKYLTPKMHILAKHPYTN